MRKVIRQTAAYRWIGLAVACIVFGVDRTLKILTNEGRLHGTFGPLQLIPLHNTGAMGGSFAHATLLLGLIGLVVIGGLLVLFVRYRPRATRPLYGVAWGFLFGAAVGNTYGRIVNGYVTDMFHFPGDHGIFNFADVSLQLGIVLLLIHVFLGQPKAVDEKREYQERKSG